MTLLTDQLLKFGIFKDQKWWMTTMFKSVKSQHLDNGFTNHNKTWQGYRYCTNELHRAIPYTPLTILPKIP